MHIILVPDAVSLRIGPSLKSLRIQFQPQSAAITKERKDICFLGYGIHVQGFAIGTNPQHHPNCTVPSNGKLEQQPKQQARISFLKVKALEHRSKSGLQVCYPCHPPMQPHP